MNDVNAILLLSCADGMGLVAKISDFIFRHNGNIVHADQHTSKIDKLFFMRIEWELNGFALLAAKKFQPLLCHWQSNLT